MTNPLNNGTIVGRVSQDIKEFPNSDGSKVLLITMAVDDNYVSGAEKTAQTNYIPVRAFIAKTVTGRGSWDRVHTGDLVGIQIRIECKSYVKNGETVYPAPTIEVDGFPQYLESKQVTETRAARKAVAAPVAEAAAVVETAAEQIARLTAELAAVGAPEVNYENTSPFAGV